MGEVPALEQFRAYQQELDGKYNKWERIVKLSRDITIESKRMIFHLHRINIGKEDLKAKVVKEAEDKADLILIKWEKIAVELKNEDSLAFLRAFSPGLQEYIEAMSFLHYFKADGENIPNCLMPLENLRLKLSFKDGPETDDGDVVQPDRLKIPIPATEYLMGVADTTGELMRLCISSAAKAVSEKSKKQLFQLCALVRTLYEMFVSLSSLKAGGTGKKNVLRNKITVMRSSLQKVEDTCYMIEVRGQEFPEHILNTFASSEVGFGFVADG